MGRTQYVVRTCHEVCRGLAVAGEAEAEQLFQLSAAVPWCGAAHQCDEEVGVHRRLAMALARVKAYWAEMDATTVAAQGSAIGRVAAEHYFEEVLEGAHLIEAQCSKNIMFE